MNYILVHSTFQSGWPELTDIDYYTENNTATVLEAQLREVLMAEGPLSRPHCLQPAHQRREGECEEQWQYELMPSAHGFSYNYKVKLPPLAVLEFLKQHGYKVVGTNTIGDTCMWTLEKQTTTTDQSTPQTTEQSTPQMAFRIHPTY